MNSQANGHAVTKTGYAVPNGYFRLRNYLLSSFTWYLRKIVEKLRRLMAEIVDFKFEKKRIIKKWEEEIDFKLKEKNWYIESKQKLKYKMEFIKMLLMMDVLLVAIIYIAFGF